MAPICRSIFALMTLAGLFWAAADAIAPEEVAVVRDGSAYTVRMRIQIDAPAARVRGFLTDYANLKRVNPAVISSEVLPAPAPEVTRVRTQIKSCVWFFCRQFELVEDVRVDAAGDIYARVVGELSDMKSGTAHWAIKAEDAVTWLSYESTMEPAFWVPPLIGPRAVMRNLRENLLITVDNLERLSREVDSAPATQ